jgi:exopolysaccharide biosynthesis polyprenyl glycosylphosphotransferase
MLREQDYLFRRANQAADFLLAEAALLAAHWASQNILRPWVFPRLIQPSDLLTHAWALAAFPALFLAFQSLNGSHRSLEFHPAGRAHGRGLFSVLEAAGATLLIGYALSDRGGGVSRALAIGGGAILAVLIMLKTALARAWLASLRRRGGGRRLILVGSGEPLTAFLRTLREHPVWRFEVAGVVSDALEGQTSETSSDAPDPDAPPLLGRLPDLPALLDETPVDEVIFVPSEARLEDLKDFLRDCELRGLRTRLALTFHEPTLKLSRFQADTFDGTPMVALIPSREVADWRLLLKSASDRVLAALGLIVLSPVFLAIALAIKLTSPRGASVFYGQERSGLNGKPFRFYKFRSMRPGADKMLEDLKASNEMSGPVFKMRQDPRITPVGRFLRRWSLDELPQLWNVLRGDMAIVGPRPPIPQEVRKYDRWQRRRLSMKPGLTCLWQVSGRNLVDFDTWMKLDLEYIDNWSLWLDFQIMLRTVGVVLTGKGAM